MNNYKTSMIAFFCFMSAFLCINTASASNTAMALNEAMDSYFHAEFDQAIAKGKEAALALVDRDNIENAYKYIGFSYIALRKEKEGIEYLKKAIRLNPSMKLDPIETSPKLINIFNKAANQMMGKLIITSEEGNAYISLDGREKGETVAGQPVTIKVVMGRHELVIKKGYNVYKANLAIEEGETKKLKLKSSDLAALKCTVEIFVNKSGTKIVLGNQKPVTTVRNNQTLIFNDIDAGEHNLYARLRRHKELDFRILVKPYTENQVNISMVLENLVLIKTDPSEADIYISGKLNGKSPLDYLASENELLTIRAKKKGYLDGNISFEYKRSGAKEVSIHLIDMAVQKIYLKGVEAEKFYQDNFDKFLVKRSRDLEKLINNYFNKAVKHFTKAIEKDPLYSLPYTALGRMYHKQILKIRTNKTIRESALLEVVAKALENSKKAIELDNDSLSYALALEVNGNVLFQQGEIEGDIEKKIPLYESSIKYFDDNITAYKKAMEKPEFHINDLERTYFNRAIVFEKIVINLSKNNQDVDEKHMENVCDAWRIYDYPDIPNPADPFNPIPNKLRKKARKHMNSSCEFY